MNFELKIENNEEIMYCDEKVFTGEYFEYFDDGEICKKIDYISGKKEGRETHYYDNGNIKYCCMYKNNLKEGMEWENHLNGVKTKLTKFEMGKKLAEEIYYPNGQTKTAGYYNGEKKEGKFTIFYDNGKKYIENTYKDDLKEGIEKEFRSDGTLYREVNYINNKKEGIEKYYLKDGRVFQESNYRNDLKEGVEKEYFFDQKLKRETNYKFGLKEGIEKTYSFNYYDNTETEVNYVAGQENGNKKIYIINSKGKYLSEKIMYKNSKKNGSHKKYDQNGNLTLEENYLDDKIVGKSTEYNNGKIKEIKIYNEEGSLLEINDYKLKKNSEEEYLEEKHKYFAPIPEGTHFCYYENEISTKYGEDGDVLSICQYKNKKLEGKAKSYFKFKGKSILMECNFKNDLFDGYTLEVLWKKNGEYHKLYNEKYFREDLPDENDDSIELLYQKRYFRAGKPHGLSIRYKSLDLSGEIEKVELFENGVSVKDTKENRKRIMSYFDDIQDSIQNKTEINTKQTSSKKQTKTVSKEKKKSKIGLAMILIIIIGIILLLSSTGIFGLMFLDMIAG